MDDRTTQVWTLQAVVFGMLLADRQFRERIAPDDFCDADMKCAVTELSQGRSNQSFHYLQKILREGCFVDWQPADGSPIDAVFSRLSRDAQKCRVLKRLTRAAELSVRGTDEAIDEFFEVVREAGNEAQRNGEGNEQC